MISKLNRDNPGFLLAKALQRWNDLLRNGFAQAGFSDVRPSFGSVLIPLFEEDGLRIGELARRSRLTKQTMTTMVRSVEKAGLVKLSRDTRDGRASRVWLTSKARRFQPVAERIAGDVLAAAQQIASSDFEAARRWLTAFADVSARN